MSTGVAVIIAVVMLVGLLALRVPVALSLLGSGATGLLLVDGFALATRTLASEPYQAVASYTLIVIPMFILMGMFAMESGVAHGAFTAANRLVGRLPGGLGVATVLVCAVFAAVSGSSPATVATVGRIAIPEMRKRGYSREFTAGIIGTAGTLGVLIPPSIVMVVFGIATGVSIGGLLVAGILPGLLSVLVLSISIVGRSILTPHLVQDRSYAFAVVDAVDSGAEIPPAPEGRVRASVLSATRAPRSPVFSLASVVVMFGTVIGGIYSGIVTATESAALGAVIGVLILVVAKRRSRQLGSSILKAMRETAGTSCMIFAIIVGASVFSVFLVRSGTVSSTSNAILAWDVSPKVLVVAILLLLLPLGMFLDATSIILITMPVFWPVLNSLGVDGLWFGVLVVVMIEIGLITPPVGINAFVLIGVADDILAGNAYRGLAPFVVVQLVVVGILFAVPEISTFLPELMRG